ncbi:MAG: AMP-binding protein, partial [Myxococcales bacterium]|nr:AMP-binding protein [Myxococcales bacterium]
MDSSDGTILSRLDALSESDGEREAFNFLTFPRHGEPELERLSFGTLAQQSRSIGEALRERFAPGDRVILLYGDGLDFIPAFLGCLRAGVVAVPVFPPQPSRLLRTLPRLLGVVEDSEASGVLTTSAIGAFREGVEEHAPGLAKLAWLASDTVPLSASAPAGANSAPEDIAYLQYTSGSTGDPKGVCITHANLAANQRMIRRAFSVDRDVVVGWLPLFHDMGLIGNVLGSLYNGLTAYLMSPISFLMKPLRWLEAVSRYGATVGGGPNFAFELCVRRSTEEERARLDLSSWRLAFCGAEPIQAHTLRRFAEAFAPAGFREEAFLPCYGLAEATLLVSVGGSNGANVCEVDAQSLAENRVTAVEEGAGITLVGSGRVAEQTEVAIVDGERGIRLREREVGEIWVRGPSVASGYWKKPEATAEVFGARIAGSSEGPYMRTGDLGFVDSGELFVTGRSKELIIVRGRNHYPQDIEATVQSCDAGLRGGGGAAFSIPAEDGDEEDIVVVQELDNSSELGADDFEALTRKIRERVGVVHGLSLRELVYVSPKSVPKTSSGKLQRGLCRATYLAGELEVVARIGAARETHAEATSYPMGVDRSDLERWLAERIRTLVGAEVPDRHLSFSALGLDSAKLVELTADLEAFLGRPISPTLLFEAPSPSQLLDVLTSADPVAQSPRRERAADADHGRIAIVGIGCRFPQANGPALNSPAAYWRLLQEGREGVGPVPEGRPELRSGGDTPLVAGFLDDVAGFDARFFRIGPAEANRMDPQQRLLLEVAVESIDDAGIPIESLAGSSTGVFVGISANEYAWLGLRNAPELDAYFATGSALSIAANRVSYAMGLRGPSMSVDTACSSSLVATHLACESLRRGECDLALAAGVNLLLSEALFETLGEAGVLAPDGKCKAFDARADGYVRGEGAGAVALKRLSDALADGDRIYAVVAGSATNNDGASNGLLAPNPAAQEAVLRAAYAAADVSPSQVAYVEAHGTGTQLGDPIEARALSNVVGGKGVRPEPLHIGSVKTNIGHLEAAAGIAGLIKVTLALAHAEIPGSLHFETPNALIPLEELGLDVPTRSLPWPPGQARIAGVSSFGFGGSNAHVVLEAAPGVVSSDEPAPDPAPWQLFPVSARSDVSLRRRVEALAPYWRDLDAREFSSAVRTASLRRSHLERRLGFVARTGTEAAELTDAWLAGRTPRGVVGDGLPVRHVEGSSEKIVFVFPGQGSQWPEMGIELAREEPVFREALEACGDALSRFVEWNLIEELSRPKSETRLDAVEIIQPSIFAVQVSLARLWQSWGIEASAVVGHSMGEVAAACVAGALSLEDGARVIALRSQLVRKTSGRGGMAAVEMTAEEAESRLAEDPRLGIAAYNGPHSLLWSGEADAIEEWVARLEKEGVFARAVAVDYASHSAQMDPLLPELEACLAELSPQAAAIPFHSTVSGREEPGTVLGASYWCRNLREPVQMWPVLRGLRENAHTTWLELSPHPVLLPSLSASVSEVEGERPAVTCVSSLRRDQDERGALLTSAGALYVAGHAVAWEQLQQGSRPTEVMSLPPYPWHHKRYWVETQAGSWNHRGGRGPHALLGPGLCASDAPERHYWEGRIDDEALAHLADHRVGGAVVFAAASYVELVGAVGHSLWPGVPILLRSIEFSRAMLLSSPRELQVTLELDAVAARRGRWRVASRAEGEDPWTVHAEGLLEAGEQEPPVAPAWQQLREIFVDELPPEELYAGLHEAGLEYGPIYRRIASLGVRDGAALCRLHWSSDWGSPCPSGVLHPALLDAGFQSVAAALLGQLEGEREPYLPVSIDTVWLGASESSEANFTCHAEQREGADPDHYLANVVIGDSTGDPVAAVAGLRVQRLARSPEDRLATCIYAERWIAEAPIDSEGAVAGPWLLFGDVSGVGAGLRSTLEAAGERCLWVRPGAEFSVTGDEVILDPERPEDFERLVELAPEWAGVVHLWSLDSAAPEGLGARGLRAAERHGSVCVLHLVQALARQGISPRLTLITEGAVATRAGEPVHPGQRPLWGLGKTLDFELPELATTRVDLDPNTTVDERQAAVLREIRSVHRETDVAWRAGERRVARLRPVVPEDAERVPSPAGERNFRLVADGSNTLEGLRFRVSPRREPGSNEIEFDVCAAGLNFKDVLMALGAVPSPLGDELPLGIESAGTVRRVGAGVTDLQVGDRVLAAAPWSLARSVTTERRFVWKIPERFSFAEAATLPAVFATAWYAFEHLARLRAGERVLIHAATGGVGQAAVQLARARGAEVFATAGTPEKREFLKAQKIEHIFDSRSLDFADEILERTEGVGVDVVLNSLAGDAIDANLRVLAPQGRYIELGLRDIIENRRVGLRVFEKGLLFASVDLGRLWVERPERFSELLSEVLTLAEDGIIEPLPRRVIPAVEVVDAFRLMAQGRHQGKVIISFEDAENLPVEGVGIRPDRTYVLTGGLGGLGLSVAAWLVAQGARQLVLVGRSAPDEPAREAVASLTSQ